MLSGEAWLEQPVNGLRLHAKFLCGYIAASLSHEEFPLLEIEQTDMGEILEVLGTASTSPNLSASGFDMNFSALELIETLEHLCISHCNLSVAAKTDILPTLVSLLVNGQVPEMKAAC